MNAQKIRQPIVTVAGHVDHGKTSILDCFRSSSVQEAEAGGITQKISFTKFPLEQIKKSCPLVDKFGIKLEIPGFLFIDTPGHAAFTNLRKRGGSLADLAILVVAIKEGIKPQTIEVLQILKANKTPFIIALNKIDAIAGWHFHKDKTLQESIEMQSVNATQEFQEKLLTFEGSLSEYGFDSDLFFNILDFTKKIAIAPCSARTKQGIPELLLALCGLSQKYLKDKLSISKTTRGVILEIKKEKSLESIETILYDGELKIGDEIAIANFNEIIVSRVRAIEEILPLSFKYKPAEKASAATGLRLHLTNKENVLSGMPFQRVENNLEKIKEEFKKEISETLSLDNEGVITKAESLGSLEALLTLLKQEKIKVIRAGIGDITKVDIISAKTNLETNPLNAVVLGFNVSMQEDVTLGNIKVIIHNVIYKLIEEMKKWREQRQIEIERARILELSPICKLEILHNFIFRNSNPTIFGVRVLGGHLKTRIELIDNEGKKIARVKGIQLDKNPVEDASEGQEVAISLPGINFERKLLDKEYLYSDISEKTYKKLKENKDLLSSIELKILEEIVDIKRKKEAWKL